MRDLLAAAACLVLSLAGCTVPDDQATAGAAPGLADAGASLPVQVTEWNGYVVVGGDPAERPTHFRPTEDVLWPYWQEGILFSVDTLPQAMEVALEWNGFGEFMIMLHSHKGHGEGGAYVAHVTPLNGTSPQCLRVPTADLTEGAWQVMVHSTSAVDAEFSLHIGLQDGEGHIVPDERHGHWYHEEPIPQADPHDIEPCRFLDIAPNATAPLDLPAETHFEFGETLGCLDPVSTGPVCLEFHAGPGGTGSGVDGHWIRLGEAYWGLMVTATIDAGSVDDDSDCAFVDAGGKVIAFNEAPEPCTAQVPERAEWFFVYSAAFPALGMTVDFALPPPAEATA